MFDYIDSNEYSHFDLMLLFLILLSVVFIVIYIKDKKKFK